MKDRQAGAINTLLIPLILVLLLFIGALYYAYSFYQSRQDYKNNVDQKVAAANAVVVQQTQAADAKQYAEAAKNPLATFNGPSTFGSVVVKYPKTWSAYVIEQSQGSPVINGYFQPGFVPDVGSQNNTFALRVEVVSTTYDQTMANFSSQVQAGQVSVAPYKPVNIKGVVGSIVTGQIESNAQGAMVVLPFPGNMTFQIWTESKQFLPDFNKYILPNFSFNP